MSEKDVDVEYRAWVKKRLAELRPVLASAVVGDFAVDLKIPEKEDEFTEVFVGVKVMTELIREQLDELTAYNSSLAETAAERSDALAEAQALTHLGSWQWDIATNEISWSDELYRIYGLKPQERQVGFDEFLSFIHPDDVERIQGVIYNSFQTGDPFEFEHRIIIPKTKRERVLYGMGKVLKDADGKPVRMLGTSQDITERKIAEQALKLSDERFQAVTRATNDLVYDHDVKTGKIWFNDVLTNEYGFSQSKDNTIDWWLSRIHPNDAERVKEALKKLLNSKVDTWNIEYRFRNANEVYISVRNRAIVLRDTDGKPQRMVGSLLDITQQKQLDRAKDEFISLVSHQLRTPLTIIRLYSEMLTGGLVGDIKPDQHEHVQKITDASVRLISLVNDMLDISRIELERVKIEAIPTDVNGLVQTHINELLPMASERSIDISFKPDKSLQPIIIDQTILSQIVYNLLENAINYTPSENGSVEVSCKQQAGKYVLKVKDSGIGIPPSAKAHIFDRFYRASNSVKINTSGTGLGLYLVKLLTETIGGKVWFESKLGSGTTFYVEIPAVSSKSAKVTRSRKVIRELPTSGSANLQL